VCVWTNDTLASTCCQLLHPQLQQQPQTPCPDLTLCVTFEGALQADLVRGPRSAPFLLSAHLQEMALSAIASTAAAAAKNSLP